MTGTLKAGLLLLALLVTVVLLAFCHQPTEPHLNDVPLSRYLDQQTYGELRTERDARESIRAFGTNAVPHLIWILEQRESSFKKALRNLAQSQSVIRFHFTPLFARQSQAALACAELGPLAAPASPALARLANDPLLCRHVITALAMIGPENFPMLTNALLTGIPAARAEAAGDLRYMIPREHPVPVLLHALNDPDAEVRSNAAGSLAFLRCQLDVVVPTLITCLRDPDAAVRGSAAQGLGWLQQDAIPALPTLLKLLHETPDAAAKMKIIEALHSIDPKVAKFGGAE